MGKLPRGVTFEGVRVKREREKQGVSPASTAVVLFGKKKAVVYNSTKPAAKPAEEQWEEEETHTPAAVPKRPRMEVGATPASSGTFNDFKFRHWHWHEIQDVDGDLARALRDEARRRRAAKATLRRAAYEAAKGWKAGPLNKAISEFGSEKQLGFSLQALNTLVKLGITLTEYTLANIVNACVRCGETDKAKEYVATSKEAWGVTPNEVVYTALLKGLCGDGRQEEATALLKKMMAEGVLPNERTASTLIRGCMRNADGRSTKITLELLKKAGVDVGACTPVVEYAVKALACDGYLNEAANFVVAGQANEAACVALATSCTLMGQDELAKAAIAAARSLPSAVPPESFGKTERRGASAAMFNRLRDREVMDELERIEDVLLGVVKIRRDVPTTFWKDPMVLAVPQGDFTFPEFRDPSLPLRVEVCSGHGEWVVGRASQEQGQANWIGVEIRPDRVYQAWTKRRLLGEGKEPKDNLLLVCGDARRVMKALAGKGVQDVFVNYPEPPGWRGSKHNLLDTDFFEAVHAALSIGGAVTVVSDHPLYAAETSMTLAKLSRSGHFFSALPPGDGVPISTTLPSDYGSSYFDRMWLNGARRKRFFSYFVKPTDTVRQKILHLASETKFDDEDSVDEDEAPALPDYSHLRNRESLVVITSSQ